MKTYTPPTSQNTNCFNPPPHPFLHVLLPHEGVNRHYRNDTFIFLSSSYHYLLSISIYPLFNLFIPLFLRFIFRFTEFLDSTIINHPTVIVESIKKLLCEVLSTGKKVLFCKMKFYKENATIKRIYITYKIALL